MKSCRKCGNAECVGRYALCQSCLTEHKRKWQFNRNLHIKLFIAKYKMENPCVDCGRISLVSEFDHVTDDKELNISHAFMKSGITIEQLQLELSKCVVRCVECHRIATHLRSNSFTGELIKADRNGTLRELLTNLESQVK